MPLHRQILTDLATEQWLDMHRFSPAEGIYLDGAANWELSKRTLRGGPAAGVDVVTLDNGALAVELLPTRGMGLWRGRFHGEPVGWNSPNRFPVHPALVNLTARQGFGWLTGFSEWMCRCGLESIGPPDPAAGVENLHGRIANLPAHHVSYEVDTAWPGCLSVRGVMNETALFGAQLRLESVVSTVAGSNKLEILDTITNLGDSPGEFQLLYHFNFGPQFLAPGGQIFAACEAITPYDDYSREQLSTWGDCTAPTPGAQQQCFMLKPIDNGTGQGSIMLVNAKRDRAALVTFALAELPCLTLWKYFGGLSEGYVVGLEPGTNYPLPRSQEQAAGRVRTLAPGEQVTLMSSMTLFDRREEIVKVAGVVIS